MQSGPSALQCPICYQTYNLTTHLPHMLPQCGHTFCSECLSSLLKNDHPNCPINDCVITFEHKSTECFPINFLAKQLIETNLKWEICEVHGSRKDVVCLSDKEKVCAHCALFDGHKEHSLKHIMEIQQEFDAQRKQLELGLANLEEHHKSLEAVLDEKKLAMQKIIEERYEEFAFILKMKKLGLLYELDIVFNKSKTKFANAFGNESSLKASILSQIHDYKDAPHASDLFSLLEKDISVFKSQLDQELLKTQVRELNQKLQEASDVFSDTLLSQVTLLTKSEVRKGEEIQEKIDTIESKEDASTNINASLSCVKIESSFEFETCNGYLEIISTNNHPTNFIMDTEDWRKMKEVRLKLDKFVLSEEDTKALEYIWFKLEHVRCIRIDASFQKNILDEHLIALFSTIFSRPHTLKEIEINFEESQIGDETLAYLAEEILPNVPTLKVITMNLNATKITETTVKTLAKNAFPVMKTLESFVLHLGGTGIPDEAFAELFVSLPTVGNFEIGLSSTSFGDNALKAFTNNTLSSMTALKKLKMRLWKTKVTDESVSHLFENMPDLKTFTLDLGSNNLTDKSVHGLINTKLPSMQNLKDFKIYLYDTKVSEPTIAKIYQIKHGLSK